jgi:hypothetical protein
VIAILERFLTVSCVGALEKGAFLRSCALVFGVANSHRCKRLARDFESVECLVETMVSHLRRSRRLKLDLWDRLRGLKETPSFGTPQRRCRLIWNRTPINQIVVSLCVCFCLRLVLPYPSLSCFALILIQILSVALKVNFAIVISNQVNLRNTLCSSPYSSSITSCSNN